MDLECQAEGLALQGAKVPGKGFRQGNVFLEHSSDSCAKAPYGSSQTDTEGLSTSPQHNWCHL